jgi:plasmid replication initiation protein
MNSNNLMVVKDNTLIRSSYFLSLTEQRLILLAIALSRQSKTPITESAYVIITANQYLDAFHTNEKSIYNQLKSACDQLFERQFSYEEVNENGEAVFVRSRWVQSVKYVENSGSVRILFCKELIFFIQELEKNFSQYKLGDIANFSSAYAIRLYELIISWKSVGETPVFALNDLRQKLGILNNEYPKMCNFKARVLDIGINQINEHSNISVIAIQHKQGRVISGFSFAFKVIDEVFKPTRKKITKKQAEEMAKIGESYKDLYSRLSKEYLILE